MHGIILLAHSTCSASVRLPRVLDYTVHRLMVSSANRLNVYLTSWRLVRPFNTSVVSSHPRFESQLTVLSPVLQYGHRPSRRLLSAPTPSPNAC